MRQRSCNAKGLIDGAVGNAASEDGIDSVDQEPGHVGQVGEGLLSNSLSFSPGLSEQDGVSSSFVFDGFDVVVGHGERNALGTLHEEL